MLLSEYCVIKRELKWKQIRPSKFISDIEYSVMTSDVIKSFYCTIMARKSMKDSNVLKTPVPEQRLTSSERY